MSVSEIAMYAKTQKNAIFFFFNIYDNVFHSKKYFTQCKSKKQIDDDEKSPKTNKNPKIFLSGMAIKQVNLLVFIIML